MPQGDRRQLYGEISKTEAQPDGTLKVYGYCSSECVDAQGEVIKAGAMQAAIPDYLKFGAVREMHQPKAAGTAIEMKVEDDGRTWFGAHVVDPIAVKKVETKTYKGFSIGGNITGRDDLDKSIITGLKLVEVSLVDRPANPEAVFTMYKAEDTAPAAEPVITEPAPAASPEPVAKSDEAPAAAGAGPVLEVTGTDDEVAEFAKVLNDSALSMGDAITALKAFVATRDAPPPEPVVPPVVTPEDEHAAKVREVAEIIAAALQMGDLNKRVRDPELPFPDLYALAIEHLGEEAIKAMKAANLDVMRDAIVEKAGARHSKVDAARLQEAHDHLCAMGAQCGDKEAAAPVADLAKVTPSEDLAKVQADLAAANERLAKLEAQPLPARTAALGLLKTSKEQDNGSAVDPSDEAAELAKYITRDADGSVNAALTLLKFTQSTQGRPFVPPSMPAAA